jgi:hypothetical protein
VEDPEVEQVVGAGRAVRSLAAVLLLVVGAVLAFAPVVPAAASTASSPVHGTISGPTVIATGSNSTYYLNASGGPAVSANGTLIGNITWKIAVSGSNSSGLAFSPAKGSVVPGTPAVTHLKVSRVPQTLTVTVKFTSTYITSNATTNVTESIRVVTPYVVHATLVVGPTSSILSFDVTVALDGRTVGTVHVPAIAANGTYNLTFDYATTGLSAGQHTFTISLAGEHGLVTFAGGAVEFSQSFYVLGPAPDYALWVLVGVAVFVGVLFIFGTRVAARRRPGTKA